MRIAAAIATLGCAFAAEPIELDGGGYLQPAAILGDQASVDQLDPATRAPLNADRFLVRRARLRLNLTAGAGHGSLELGANTVNGPQVRFIRALAGLQLRPRADGWPLLDGRIGLMPTPFGGALQRGSSERPFLERSLAERAFFPGTHDVGAELRGQWRFVRYQLAAMNGTPISTPEQAGQDPTAAKDLLARIGTIFEGAGWQVEAGASVLVGEGLSPGAPSTKDSVQWQDANQNGAVEISELQPIAGVAGRPAEAFPREALGADLRGRFELPWLGPLEVFGELYWGRNLDRGALPADPVTLGRDLREVGLQAGFWQAIRSHGLVGLRIDTYDPDADATERIAADLVPLDRSVTTVTGVLGWTSFAPLQLFLQYDHEDNRRGRGADGSPARLAADRLTLWAQVAR